jgi:hypothetical protein
MKEEQKIELVKPFGDYKKDYFSIDDVPPEIVEQLFGDWPNTHPQDRQNNSPNVKKMVKLAKQYNGTLDGYCIPVASGREDARISFDALNLKVTKEDAKRLKRNLKPNDFKLKEDGSYWFWWD